MVKHTQTICRQICSGITEHTVTCHGQFNWIHPKVTARQNDYRRRKIR